MRWIAIGLLLGSGACQRPEPLGRTPEPAGPLGVGLANPFPQAAAVVDGHLELEDLPEPDADTPLPLETLRYRSGFSRAQVAVLRWPDLDRTAVSCNPSGGVRLFDLTSGEQLPCFAELDAAAETEPALLVRPLTALPEGGEVAVVVTTAVMRRPRSFRVDGERTGALLDRLETLGVPIGTVAVAWSFPVDDGGTAPLRSALAQLDVLGPATLVEDEAARTLSLTHRVWRGSYPVVDFVGDGGLLDLADDGAVSPRGEASAPLTVHVPASVADAPAGTVPVLVFGHGIFSSADAYLGADDDGDGVRLLADELGAIVVATTWRGLTTADLGVPLAVSEDLGQFPRIPGLLVQAQVNVRTLVEGLRDGTLIDHPAFEGASGQRLPDPQRIRYYGISLGAIEGAVMLAHDPGLDAAALHVGGAMWSTMLERSSNWSVLEPGLLQQIPDPGERQVLYALTQLWWDPVEPMSYAGELSDARFLYQVSVGDEQVPNFTSIVFAGAVGLPVAEPAPFEVSGLSSLPTPTGGPARALVWFDPERPDPTPRNRPAEVTGAHTAPRTWAGARRQVVDYLDVDEPQRIVHHCGAEPCTASNAAP